MSLLLLQLHTALYPASFSSFNLSHIKARRAVLYWRKAAVCVETVPSSSCLLTVSSLIVFHVQQKGLMCTVTYEVTGKMRDILQDSDERYTESTHVYCNATAYTVEDSSMKKAQ